MERVATSPTAFGLRWTHQSSITESIKSTESRYRFFASLLGEKCIFFFSC